MRSWLTRSIWGVALAAQVGVVAAREAENKSEEDRTVPRISVYVYDYSKAPAEVLEEARQEVVRIYRAAGVEVEWVDCPCVSEDVDKYRCCQPGPSRQDWVAVRIVSRSMMGGLRLDPSKFGLAVLREGEFESAAYVCFQCAEDSVKGRRFLERRPKALGRILGDLIAYEVGHLVLATTRHSGSGVMRGDWSPKDVEDAAFGRRILAASSPQKKGLRQENSHRCGPIARPAAR